MATVLEIIQRTYSENLFAGAANPPAWDIQTNTPTISDSSTALTVEGRQDAIPRETVLEWDDATMELALVKSVSGTSVTLQERGYLNTTGATHNVNTRVILDNPFPKIAVFNTLRSIVSQLYALGLYSIGSDTSNSYTTSAAITLPSAARDTFPYMWLLLGTRYIKLQRGRDFEVLYDFSPLKVQFFNTLYGSGTLTIPYKKDFTRPTAVTDDLDTLNVSTSVQDFLPLGIAGQLLLGKEVPRAQAEHMRRILAQQGIQAGTLAQLGRVLWTGFLERVAAERQEQFERNPTVIVYG